VHRFDNDRGPGIHLVHCYQRPLGCGVDLHVDDLIWCIDLNVDHLEALRNDNPVPNLAFLLGPPLVASPGQAPAASKTESGCTVQQEWFNKANACM
jgi:hypothetical protein